MPCALRLSFPFFFLPPPEEGRGIRHRGRAGGLGDFDPRRVPYSPDPLIWPLIHPSHHFRGSYAPGVPHLHVLYEHKKDRQLQPAPTAPCHHPFTRGSTMDIRPAPVPPCLLTPQRGELARNHMDNTALRLAKAAEARVPAYSRHQQAAIWR